MEDKQHSTQQINREMETRGRLSDGAINTEMGKGIAEKRPLIRRSTVSLCQSRLHKSPSQSSEVTADCQTLFHHLSLLKRPNRPEPVSESHRKAL